MLGGKFFEDVLFESLIFTDGMNKSIKNGATYASEILNDYIASVEDLELTDHDRIMIMNAISKIADMANRSIFTNKSLDFRMGMLYFADSVAHVAFQNDLIDGISYWSLTSLIAALRGSYIALS